MKELLASGCVTLKGELPLDPDGLYDPATLQWRRRTRAGELFETSPPASHGLDDSHLDVARAARERPRPETESEEEEAMGHLRAFVRDDSGLGAQGSDCGDAAGLHVGSGAVGAERARPTRTRNPPSLLQMPPTMRGGESRVA